MIQEKSPSYKIITETQAADALINPKTLRWLEPFLASPTTISEAAKQTASKPNTVLSRVKRFMKLGLIKIVKEEKRAGRAIKWYRTSSDSFFVPFAATTAESLEEMMAERDSYWENMLRQAVVQSRMESIGTWGTRFYKDKRGHLQVQTAIGPTENHDLLEPNAPAALSGWRDSVFLDFEEAKQLQNDMFELLTKYQKKSGAQRYIIRLGMAAIRN